MSANESRQNIFCNIARRYFPVFALTICLFSTHSFSATYYVRKDGNNNNTGFADSPSGAWQTISKCASTMAAGDKCVIGNGVYAENVTETTSGNIDGIILFQAQNKQSAILQGTFTVNANYVKIDGLQIDMPANTQRGIKINGNFDEVLNCRVTTNSSSLGINNIAIEAIGDNIISKQNYVEKTCFGYQINGANHTFQQNEAYNLMPNGQCGDVDYMRFFGSNHRIENNYFHGINMDQVGTSHVDCFQTFDNNGNSSTNILIDSNYCSDSHNGMMVEAKYYSVSTDLFITNNVFNRKKGWCASITDFPNVHFYNNTCDYTGGLFGLVCRGSKGTGSCEFKNNVIYGAKVLSAYGVIENATLIDGATDAPGKNNLLYNPNVAISSGYSNDIKNQDPQFKDISKGDYALSEGSPAIDAGLSIASFSTDKNGTPRPSGSKWDIGAYEFKKEGSLSLPGNLRVIK